MLDDSDSPREEPSAGKPHARICGGEAEWPSYPTIPRPDPTFTVSGVVVGQGSAPVEGAQVRVAGQSATTDGNGYYSLTGVPGSYGGVSAIKTGYAVARKILTVSGDLRLDFELGPRVAIYTLSGVVAEATPAGLVPIEGVLVEEYSCEDASPSPPFFGSGCPVLIYQTTTTDKNGTYRFSGLYGGKGNSIGARKEGFEDPLVPDVPEGPNVPDNSRKVTLNGDTHYEIQLVRR